MLISNNAINVKNGKFDADWSILKILSAKRSIWNIEGMVLHVLYYQSCSALFGVVLFFSAIG